MRLRGHAGWLVLVSAVACSVYQDDLLTVGGSVSNGGGGTTGGGGDTSQGGDSGSAGTGASTSGGKGGSAGSGGSSGGSTSKGGTTSQGGTPQYQIIDDMEDGNTIVAVMGNRNGRWVTDNDGEGTTTPPKTNFPGLISELTGADARAGSTYAVRLRAVDFQNGEWGAFFAVHFRFPDSTLYDASAYCGIRFWAKTSADSAGQIEIRIPDQYTIPAGGFCTDPLAAGGAGGGPGLCYDHHAKVLVPTPEWQEFTVNFSEMMQSNWPNYEQSPLDGLDLSAVTSIEFFMAKPATYELWVDDLSFINKPAGDDCP